MQQFQLGITMAGAISAGAYSGGVFDMLFEVLEAWQQAKDGGEDVPMHDVVVPVISGASAGSITGAIGLVALADAQAGTLEHHPYKDVGAVVTRLPRLYATWVTGPRFVASGKGDALLGTVDLEKGIYAALDTTILDRIAEAALAGFTTREPRKYLASGFHLFVTASNIQGVPYEIRFDTGGGTEPYVMTCHADRVHFKVDGVGSARVTSAWADPDPAVPLDVASLVGNPAPHGKAPWSHFINATVGSSAFPVGLRARPLPTVSAAELSARQWPITGRPPGAGQFCLPTAQGWSAAAAIERRAVDGGVIDNEPFELARWTLMDNPPTSNKRLPNVADRAVLMIDPFPSVTVPEPALPDDALMAVVGRFVPMLIDQVRFKLDAAVADLDPAVSSRFLISPRRYTPLPNNDWKLEKHSIACGLMGGFGGFLSEAMRAHDYQLGRLNAYRFLKMHFCFPLDNPVVRDGYATVRDAARFRGTDGPAGPIEDGEPRFQMIPVTGKVAEPDVPTWPRVSQQEVDDFVSAAGARAIALADKAAVSTLVATGVWVARQLGLRSAVETFVRWTVMKELYLRNQFADLPPQIDAALDDDGRRVLAAFAEPGYALRTPEGIAAALRLSVAVVDAWIAKLEPLVQRGPVRGSWKLAERRRRGWLQRHILGEGRIG